MPTSVKSFSMEFIAITAGTLPALSGFASGDALTLSYPNDDFEAEQGSDGFVIWIQKHNHVVDGTLRIAQGNPVIAQLRQLVQASKDAGGITYPFQAKNLKSPDEVASGTMMFKKQPDIAFADSSKPAEFTFGLTPDVFAGGTITPT